MKEFIHLHVHTIGSLLDGYNKIDNLIEKVKDLNMNAVAITDHGNLTETFTFQKKCLNANIKPILGIEAYHTKDRHIISMKIDERREMALNWYKNKIKNAFLEEDDSLTEEELEIKFNKYKKDLKLNAKKMKEILENEYNDFINYDTKNYHLILLAKNQTGWNNLIKLISIANDEGRIIKNKKSYAFIDNELLKQYSEGLICTTACISSMINNNILEHNLEEAEKQILELKEIFKDDFYLEIQPLDLIKQIQVNLALIDFSKKHNIKLVATTDSHYTNKKDYKTHDVLLCLGMEKKIDDETRIKYKQDFWIKNYDEMIEGFKKQYDSLEYIELCKEALANTLEISNKITKDIKLGSDHELLPKIDVPINYTPETWLSHQCWTNLYKYLKKENKINKIDTYEERLQHELNVIITKGFASYILIVQDAIEWGDKNNCPFGPRQRKWSRKFSFIPTWNNKRN